jgi:pilus assembly protein CpaE
MVFSLVKERTAPASKIPKGRIIGVLSAKGGCGASTLAINISANLAEKGGPTILVDANLQNPDAALMLGKTSQFGLLELVTGASEPTPEAVEACVVPLSTGKTTWSLLSPPLTGEAALKTQLTDVARCITQGRNASHFWVVDLPNHLDRHLVTQLDACDVIVLVFEETMPGVSAARRWWNTFTQLGYADKHLFFVINRAGSRTGAAEARVKDLLPPECLRVPNCFSLCDDSVTAGDPPVLSNPRHKFSQAVSALVQKILQSMNEESHE